MHLTNQAQNAIIKACRAYSNPNIRANQQRGNTSKTFSGKMVRFVRIAA